MNIDTSYKDLFCCFCLIFTAVFQIFFLGYLELLFIKISWQETNQRGPLAQLDVIHKTQNPFPDT